MQEAPRRTLIRRSDEPKLEIGDIVLIREGLAGVVIASFIPSGEKRNEVHYIVQLKPYETEKGTGKLTASVIRKGLYAALPVEKAVDDQCGKDEFGPV